MFKNIASGVRKIKPKDKNLTKYILSKKKVKIISSKFILFLRELDIYI